jgi:hypothetical protein
MIEVEYYTLNDIGPSDLLQFNDMGCSDVN